VKAHIRDNNLLIYILGILQDSNQSTIIDSFNRRFTVPIEAFSINYFKRLLLAFIIANNILFRAVTIRNKQSVGLMLLY
jgi:hypothetical protein